MWRSGYFNKLILITSVSFTVFSCALSSSHQRSGSRLIKSPYWVDNNTLQMVIQTSSKEKIPYTMRRQSLCRQAKEMAPLKAAETFPKLLETRFQVKVVKTLYYNREGCDILVHFTAPMLRNKI